MTKIGYDKVEFDWVGFEYLIFCYIDNYYNLFYITSLCEVILDTWYQASYYHLVTYITFDLQIGFVICNPSMSYTYNYTYHLSYMIIKPMIITLSLQGGSVAWQCHEISPTRFCLRCTSGIRLEGHSQFVSVGCLQTSERYLACNGFMFPSSQWRDELQCCIVAFLRSAVAKSWWITPGYGGLNRAFNFNSRCLYNITYDRLEHPLKFPQLKHIIYFE